MELDVQSDGVESFQHGVTAEMGPPMLVSQAGGDFRSPLETPDSEEDGSGQHFGDVLLLVVNPIFSGVHLMLLQRQ